MDSLGSPCDEVVRVGHMGFRVPPITHGQPWVGPTTTKASTASVVVERAIEKQEQMEKKKKKKKIGRQ